jgi:hypothetical protein
MESTMTDNELLMLVAGMNIGVFFMILVHAYGRMTEARRDQRTAEASLSQTRKYVATDGWRQAVRTWEWM